MADLRSAYAHGSRTYHGPAGRYDRLIMREPLVAGLMLLGGWALAQEAPAPEIRIDQVGYPTGAPKVALVVSDKAGGEFVVRRARDGRVAFNGRLGDATHDPDSGDRVRAADFSALREPARYVVDVPGVGRSWPFEIGADPYRPIFRLAARAFYGQRCGTAVDMGPDFPDYRHGACHLKGVFHPSSGREGPRASTRGWHDAGDYGRYIVNSGITTATLLWTWELFGPRIERIALDIPESRNAVPDLLDEIRWNLDWMLSMQDEDGGVWHKQTTPSFSGFVMPEEDTVPSAVIGTGTSPFTSSCATADFAAVTAAAARVYRRVDAAYADAALAASRRAWAWVERHPDVLFRNPPDVSTGAYGDRDCGDERLWAAAELWRTTREPGFERAFLALQETYRPALRADGPPSWARVAPLGLWTYVLGGGRSPAAADIRRESLAAADAIVARTLRHGYRQSLVTADYVWGSNGVVANYGVQLLVANAMQPRRAYVEAALDNLHYLLGRNTFSVSWITRAGSNPYRHPHHRPSGADRNAEPWPGMLSGGPNRNRNDPAMKRLPEGPPARMYLDEEASYASNEMAVNWNAPLVFVLAGVMSGR